MLILALAVPVILHGSYNYLRAYEVFPILLDHDSDNIATTAADFCTGTRTSSTFYYLAEEGSSLTLLDIAKEDIPIFKTYDGALNQDSSLFAAKQIYIETSTPNDGWFYFGSVLVRFEIKKGLPSSGEGVIIKVS